MASCGSRMDECVLSGNGENLSLRDPPVPFIEPRSDRGAGVWTVVFNDGAVRERRPNAGFALACGAGSPPILPSVTRALLL